MPTAATLTARLTLGLLLASGATGAAFAGQDRAPADTIITNARVYTVDTARPWAEAVAIRDGKIVAVGTRATVERLKGSTTRVVDLGGRLIMPAFGDAHAHPLFGALSFTRCSLHNGKSIEDYQAIIRKCIADNPGTGTIYGAGWEDSLFPPNGVPHKKYLDAVSTDRPLIFDSVGGHTNWVNSKALELAGITKDTPDPVNGSIDRDPATGEPIGGLQESAQRLMQALIPPVTDKNIQDSVKYTAKLFNSLGIVSWNDAGVAWEEDGSSAMIDAYKAVRDAGELTSYVTVSLTWKNDKGMEQLPGLLKAAARGNALGVPTHTVKFYVDGVIPQKTAYMISPYEHSHEHGSAQVSPETLKQAVSAVDSRGMHAFLHAIGDNGVRISLDAIEAARTANGKKPTHHMVTHLNVVDPADQPRFGKLDTFAQFQPTWSSWYPYMELTEQAIGKERMKHIYPAGSIVRMGGKLAYGADWPVATANPLEGLEVAMTRRTAGDPAARPLIAEEGVTLEQAIESHTLNVAYVNGFDKVTGSITPGKNADLIVLDRDLFKIPTHEIGKTKVLVTLFKGKAVYGALEAAGK
ncbi:amidohydrolase [Sphingomonas sp. R647]|uniref:amidohydrolase n=1 Tax=Sphingomonas sp. R647 TaxID=2875233 RepID=UPI001CD5A214|nr:amidohydrolase [Sphingomonas sp. R647]MCA1200205.1 amidohydrolase [Sphingomonas sp. R647]